MDDTRMLLGYCQWIIIVALTIGLFNYFSKKQNSLIYLLFYCLFPTWLISSVITGLIGLYFDSTYDYFSAIGFIGNMMKTLPHLILIGGITFSIKYLKFKRQHH